MPRDYTINVEVSCDADGCAETIVGSANGGADLNKIADTADAGATGWKLSPFRVAASDKAFCPQHA